MQAFEGVVLQAALMLDLRREAAVEGRSVVRLPVGLKLRTGLEEIGTTVLMTCWERRDEKGKGLVTIS